jgi:vacuolar-type H+-ATPase subunit H
VRAIDGPTTAPEPGTVDFLYLLERLEEALVSGSRVPLTARTLVDENECLDILEQMRLAVPNEIRLARRVIAERETLLSQAREEAERMFRAAELRAGRLVEEHALARSAQARAIEIEDEAERAAQEIRAAAERYAGMILTRVDERLAHALESIRAGLDELEQSGASAR